MRAQSRASNDARKEHAVDDTADAVRSSFDGVLGPLRFVALLVLGGHAGLFVCNSSGEIAGGQKYEAMPVLSPWPSTW